MNYPRNCSASGMFVFNNIPSFMELWRNYIYGFNFYAATHKQRQFSRRCHCFFLSAVIRSVEALGVCIIQLPSVVFYVTFICIFIFTVRETDIGVCFNYFMYLCLHVS